MRSFPRRCPRSTGYDVAIGWSSQFPVLPTGKRSRPVSVRAAVPSAPGTNGLAGRPEVDRMEQRVAQHGLAAPSRTRPASGAGDAGTLLALGDLDLLGRGLLLGLQPDGDMACTAPASATGGRRVCGGKDPSGFSRILIARCAVRRAAGRPCRRSGPFNSASSLWVLPVVFHATAPLSPSAEPMVPSASDRRP